MSKADGAISLSATDYAVFGLILAVSAAVGVFFAYRDRKGKKVQNYLLANRKISPWASGMSAALSFLSATTVLGVPAEMVYFGATYTWYAVGTILATLLSCEAFLPMFYKLELSSANEYLGLRFGKAARQLATVVYLIQTIAFSGVMIYAPALALNSVSSLSLWGAIWSIGIVCTAYTTLGGLKAVIWTDVFQGITLFVVLLIILFKSAAEVGGFGKVFAIASQGDRLDYFHFEFDPRYRMTVWATLFGLGTSWASIATTNQAMVQRFLCCRSVSDGKKAMYVFLTCICSIFLLLTILGFTTYAYFFDCDPLQSRAISARDQIFPYLTVNILRDIPGLSGLFVAGLFAAALSSISSSINGMSCVTVTDLIKPNVKCSEKTLLYLSKALTFIYGALCMAFAYFSSLLGGLLQVALGLLGLCAGVLLGPVVMGTLFPLANAKGAISGMLVALVVNIWIYIGAITHPTPKEFTRLKDLSTNGCSILHKAVNETFPTVGTLSFGTSQSSMSLSQDNERFGITQLFAVSFTYYGLIGLVVCLFVGMIVSCATGGLVSRYDVEPKLIGLPFEHPLLRWLPVSFRQLMRPRMADREVFNHDMDEHQEKKICIEIQNAEAKDAKKASSDQTFDVDNREIISSSV